MEQNLEMMVEEMKKLQNDLKQLQYAVERQAGRVDTLIDDQVATERKVESLEEFASTFE
jgi:hypothetical protein